MITYLDSHCHITSDRLYARIDEILENCHAHQVGELLVERCDAALEPGDPLLETVDAAAEFRIVVVAATCREGDGGQKQEI